MKIFPVEIKETLSKIVPIKAFSEEQAEDIAARRYQDCIYVLDADDYQGVEFNACESEAA